MVLNLGEGSRRQGPLSSKRTSRRPRSRSTWRAARASRASSRRSAPPRRHDRPLGQGSSAPSSAWWTSPPSRRASAS